MNSSQTLTAQPVGPLASDGQNKSYKQNGVVGNESGSDEGGDKNAANTNNKNQRLSGETRERDRERVCAGNKHD